MEGAVEFLRVVLVIALLCIAGAITTPKGRLPLALRGLKKLLGKAPSEERSPRVSSMRRFIAFLLILFAFAVAAFF